MKRIALPLLISMACLTPPAYPMGIVVGDYLQMADGRSSLAQAGKDILLNNARLSGNLLAGRDLRCDDCNIAGRLLAGRDVRLNHAAIGGSLMGGRDVELRHSRAAELKAGRHAQLDHSQLDQGLQAGGDVTIRYSEIRGPVHLGGSSMTLDQGNVAGIRFERYGMASGVRTSGTGLIIRNHGGNHSVASMGSQGLSMINGYTIRAASGQTTVMTPDHAIYVNGRKVAGNGPEHYGEYKKQVSGAPEVRGPGWPELDMPESKNAASEGNAVYHLELRNNSVVSGDVEFIGGSGTVVVYPGSELRGKVINGSVEHRK